EVFKDAVIWDGEEILTQAGKPLTVFTPYSKSWKTRSIPAPRPRLKKATKEFEKIKSDELPAEPKELGHPLKQTIFPAGEAGASEALKNFLKKKVFAYGKGRDFPAKEGTSQLSAHLRAGTIGIRTVMEKLKAARSGATKAEQANCDVFLNELIWREFY